jgi:hypothetical protein
MKKCLIVLFLMLISFCTYSEEWGNIEPYTGLYGIAFTTEPKIVHSIFPLVGIGIDFNIAKHISLGGKAGIVYDYEENDIIWTYAGILNLRINNRYAINIDLGLFPGIGLTVDKNHINLGLLPFYMLSGGATLLTLTYGYKI